MLNKGVWCGVPLGERNGVGTRVGRSSAHSSLRPMAWPGLAWQGRLVFLTNEDSQPHALSVLSCLVLTVPSSGPGSLQVRLRASTPNRTQASRSPGLRSQVAGSSGRLWGWREHAGMVGAQLVRPGAPSREHC